MSRLTLKSLHVQRSSSYMSSHLACLVTWTTFIFTLTIAFFLECRFFDAFIELRYCETIIALCSWVNFCCLLWLSSFRLSALVVLTMLFTVAEHMNIFSFVFHFLSTSLCMTQHQLNVNHLTVAILLCCFALKLISQHLSKPDLYHGFCEFHTHFFCVQYWHWLQVVLTVMLMTVRKRCFI
jgi:hypothetical protein